MTFEERIKSFSALGETLRDSLNGQHGKYSAMLNVLIENQHILNPWFTPENVRFAIDSIASDLTYDNLSKWTGSYPLLKVESDPFKVGLILAGNIPLVGFHDFMSVLISGNKVVARTSSKDSKLLPFLGEILCSINPEFSDYISFTEGRLSGFDSVIATGSNNSSRYFEYYFGKYPHIIRKNRNSLAIIDGSETKTELEELGKDIFTYFGLGCRNVSKIYLPAGYDPDALTLHWDRYSGYANHSKYANNYDFNKAVYLVNRLKFHDTGYLLLREEENLSSPVSVLNYEFYKSGYAVEQQTDLIKDKIQCVIGKKHIPFGQAQSPELWDYADGIDTLEFLLRKKN